MTVAKHPTPSAPCQVEWESQSYQLITFQTFPMGGGGGSQQRRLLLDLDNLHLSLLLSLHSGQDLGPQAQVPSMGLPGPCTLDSRLPSYSFIFWPVLFFLSLHFLSSLLTLFSLSSLEFVVGSGETRPGFSARTSSLF